MPYTGLSSSCLCMKNNAGTVDKPPRRLRKRHLEFDVYATICEMLK